MLPMSDCLGILRWTLLLVAALRGTLQAGDDRMADYLAWRARNAPQPTVELHYTDHQRGAVECVSGIGRLRFKLEAPHIGMSQFGAHGQPGLVAPGSLSLRITTPAGDVYETRRAAKAARVNVFRHGPHYLDARVFDLTPTDETQRTLPIQGELIFHIWPDRLYVEARLHAEQPVSLDSASLTMNLKRAAMEQTFVGSGADFKPVATRLRIQDLSGKDWLAFVGRGQVLSYALPAPDGTQALVVQPGNDELQIVQEFELPDGGSLLPGRPVSVAVRLDTRRGLSVAPLADQAALEAVPLSDAQFTVGPGAVFSGYNPRAGYYTIGTARPESLSWLYQHADVISTASLAIHNEGPPRTIAIRHENTTGGGRLGAGVVTDVAGRALPILVQNSKNFSGEDEEPFYNPGDPEYNESYFLLPLRRGDQLDLQSHHTFQNWGKHPIKQVGSLQAWMHYYQMSLGVTETTCHVPFRFGGHGGIWIADLRGISGQMWPIRLQPQFDNVGGHRVFHYRDATGEHFLRYLRTRFRSTGPNLADFSMDYVTEGGEARVSFDICEPPQTDVTRCFMTMRVQFDQPLVIHDARRNLRLISLDTTTQKLRYDAFGYTDDHGQWQHIDPNQGPLPIVKRLARTSPLIAFSGNRSDSHQHGNNAILVQKFSGTASGQPIAHLATGLDVRSKAERVAWISPDVETLEFAKGDFLELQCVVIPYGHVGEGPEAALVERERYGTKPPRVAAEVGQVLDHFPVRIAVAENGTANFRIDGGFGVVPVLLEGFASYAPPRLEVRRQDADWKPLVMGTGQQGHQAFFTNRGKLGFVFLVETDGAPVFLTVGPSGNKVARDFWNRENAKHHRK